MVLGEFSDEEKEIVFSDKGLRGSLINHIKKYFDELEDEIEITEDIIINLALEHLLGTLEDESKAFDNGTVISGIEESYLMANINYIKNDILKE